jgi:hypothetical protein
MAVNLSNVNDVRQMAVLNMDLNMRRCSALTF